MYKYYLTMAHYPSEKVMLKVFGNNAYVDINTHRWNQTVVVDNEEEFEYWKTHHPEGWSVMSVDEVEEI